MPREPLSNIDTAWLRIEGASHPMMITMAMAFGAPLDADRLGTTFRDRLPKRLHEVKCIMDALKSSPEATLIYGLLGALGLAPAETQAALVESYCTRDNAMTANLPRPAKAIQLAGAPLETLLSWVPAFGGVGLNLNIPGANKRGVPAERQEHLFERERRLISRR